MALQSNALTTPTRLATFLGKTLTSALEAQYILQINAASAFIRNHLGYDPKQTVYTNYELDSNGEESILLPAFPVSTSASFLFERRNSSTNEDDWETVDSEHYHVDHESGIIFSAGRSKFAQVRKGFRATFTAGFDFDNASTFLGDTDGADLEMAIWLLTSDVLSRGGSAVGIKSESIGDYRIVYQSAMMQSEEVQSILDRYTRLDDLWMAGPLTPVHY